MDWDALGDSGAFYRRTTLYSDIDLRLTSRSSNNAAAANATDLADYVCVGARDGGPVAYTADDSKLVVVQDQGAASSKQKKRIWIHSAAGNLIRSIVWDHPSRIVKMGFTSNEALVVLAKDGTYRIYPISTAGSASENEPSTSSSSAAIPPYSQHSLAHDMLEAATVLDARIYEYGMVVLLSSYQFLEVKGWPENDIDTLVASSSSSSTPTNARGGRVERFVGSGLDRSPPAWCLLTPEQSTSRQAEVLFSPSPTSPTLMSIDQLEIQDQHFSKGPFSHILPSPNGRFIALLTLTSSKATPRKLYVVSSNYAETLSEYELSEEQDGQEPIKNMVWCGNNSVVLAWETSLLMVGPYGQTLRYYYMDAVHLITEVDGVRIHSLDKCEFLQKVPASIVAIYSPGSTHPAAILAEAYNQFISKNAQAHELLTNIKIDLLEAVDTCIDAASREYSISSQRSLLKMASFGKTFLDLYNPNEFVNMANTLRVLNAVRYYDIGIPISYDQYTSQFPSALISRLIRRNHHLLALRICSFLKISGSPVLRHWAQLKVLTSKNDATDSQKTCNIIVNRLKENHEGADSLGGGQVSCADVAKTAWDQGKTALAAKLLEHEPRASKQVHLLLNMKEDNLALSKASRSGDSDLILSVLLSLRKQHSLGTFFRFLDGKDEAIAILTNYGKAHDKELVKDFWFQDDRRTESACFDLEQAAAYTSNSQSQASSAAGSTEILSAEHFGEKMEKIRSAQKTFGEDKERGFEVKMCEEQLRLLAFQQTLQTEADATNPVPYVGLSLNETIRQCLIHPAWAKKAEKLRADFKVSDKRWWYIKLKALTETRNWEQLEIFSKSKRSPIGFEPFADHLIATGNTRQALNYIPKCEARNRAELYVRAGEWVRAAEECRDRGDRGKLNELILRSPNNVITAQLTSILENTRSF